MPSFPATPNLPPRSTDEFTAFYLTDYLARHFDKLIWAASGLIATRTALLIFWKLYQAHLSRPDS